MLKDNEQLKMALRSYMGGLNPLQHAINGPFTDNLLVNSPLYLFSPSLSSPCDSDYYSSQSSSRSSCSGNDFDIKLNQKFPSILKPVSQISKSFPSDDKDQSKIKKSGRIPLKQKASPRKNSEWILTSIPTNKESKTESSNLLGIPVIEGVQVIRNLQKSANYTNY